MNSKTLRQTFLGFFASHNHQIVPSSSLVPNNDPTLYFTNAGMVPFKNVFIGQEVLPYKRACSSQKCLRVSGKHNDFETVGKSPRHHTFFEMLGNFSFGDYFKEEAITLAWSFLTEELKIPASRLKVTTFAGDETIPEDKESFNIWNNHIGLPASSIIPLGKNDNFWSMGDVGPCGPCSEIFYFVGSENPCSQPPCSGPGCSCNRWVEIWNLVFMQFSKARDGNLEVLTNPGVDTGMGLERLSAVMQGVRSNFDTDLFQPIIEEIGIMANVSYGDNSYVDTIMRTLADHARTATMCIADGVFPDNKGREYVLRRIMRRAIYNGHKLGFVDNFFWLVCSQVVSRMGQVFPELITHRKMIETICKWEETTFRRTLKKGLEMLMKEIEKVKGGGETR